MKYVGVKTTGELRLHETDEVQTDKLYMAVEDTKVGASPIKPYQFVKWDGAKWVKVNNVELATTLDTKNIEDALAAAVDDLQDKIDEVTLDPSTVALGNVHLLDEVTEFPADGCILIDSETDGPGEMPKDTLLELTAQNALAGNVVQEFDPTRTSENQYTIGQSCIYNGKSYTFINNHYGAWSSSDAVSSDETDRLPLAVEKTFNVVGAGSTGKYKVFPCDGVKSIRIKPTPNPWPTDTIGGVNPAILGIYSIDDYGSSTTVKEYYINATIPSSIDCPLPDGTKFLKFFVRANVGSSVTFSVANLDYTTALSDVRQLKSDVVDLENDLVTHGSLTIPLTGANLTAQTYYVGVKGLVNVSVTPTPNPWPTDTIGGVNPSILILYSVNSAGVETSLASYPIGSTIPEQIKLTIPSGCEKLKIFFRANSGSTVSFLVEDSLITGLNEQKTILSNVVGDIGKSFDPTKQYAVGEKLSVDGKLYGAIYPHIGTWNAAHFASGDIYDLQTFDYSKSISFVGAGLTAKNLYVFLTSGIDKLVLTHGDWYVNTIGGSNPTLLQVFAIKADGTQTSIIAYFESQGIPDRVELSVPEDAVALRFFVRANTGTSVKLFIERSSYEFISSEKAEQIDSLSKSYGQLLKKFLLMGDPHASKTAFDSYKVLMSEYSFDGIVVLGDICRGNPYDDDYDNWDSFVSKTSGLILPVIGNHDVGVSQSILKYVPLSVVVDNVMKPCIDKGLIATTHGYYYKDVGDVRIIVINNYNIEGVYDSESKWERVAYDPSKPQIEFSTSYSVGDVVNVGVWTDYSYRATENLTTPASNPSTLTHDFPCWSARPDAPSIDAVQAQWMLDTMLATPSDMGIVIVMHAAVVTSYFIDKKSKFSQQYNTDVQSVTTGNFFVNAADAYNEGETFTATIGGVEVSADFSHKNDSVFVGFISGHQHQDLVLRSTSKPKYYNVCVNMSMPSYVGWHNDVWVNSGSVSATVACFDRYRKSTNLVKVGVDLTCDGYKRDNERIEQSYTE